MKATILTLTALLCAAVARAADPLPSQIEDLYKTDLALDAITLADGRSAIYVRQRADAGTRTTRQSLWRASEFVVLMR